MALTLVPCNHFWLEMETRNQIVIALCKTCHKRAEFEMTNWEILGAAGMALNKPTRI